VSDFDLPGGWLQTSLGEIADWGSGGTPSRKTESYYGGTIPWVKTGDLGPKVLTQASEFITGQAIANSSAKFFPKGSVAIAMYGATIGKTSILGIDATTNQACGVGSPIKGVTFTEFLYYMLCNEKDNFIAKGKGGAQPNISQALIKEHEIALPPLAEQHQIAQKLNELLAQVDTLKTRLDAIPKILKRFRQSVLAAAVSGRLTEEWRGVQAEKLDEWRWVTLGEISDVKGGITKDSKKQESAFIELPYLRVANVQRYFLDLNEIKTIRIPANRVKDLLLEDGDILFNEGGDLDKLGRGWIWEGQIPNCSYQNHVFRARLKNRADNSKYISWWGNTEGFEYFIRNGKQTTNLASINKTLLSNLPINLPPSKEQTEIVRRVEQLFTYADQIEQRVKDAQKRVNHLTQSILAKAFRGELTAEWRAQNPDLISGENSAAALLERIKAEREATAKPKKKVKV